MHRRSSAWRRALASLLGGLLEGARARPRRRRRAAAAPPRSDRPRRRAAADDAGIAWRKAASDAEVDAAFARSARASRSRCSCTGAPKWCPPCNQVKATLFNRQDFIERSRAFVPVYIDGDRPGAQKLGARFRGQRLSDDGAVRPDGTELTRLPGEVEPARYTRGASTLGMNAQRPVKDGARRRARRRRPA